MKNKHLSVLAIVTVIVVIAAVLVSKQDAPQSSMERTPLFPKISDKINSLGEISIQSGDQSLSVVKENGQWLIRQADNYPARFEKIKEVAIAVSDLHILAEKTSNPTLYGKLGVEDPAMEDASSSLLILKDDKQTPMLSLIVGNKRQNKSSGGKAGLYVRLPDSGPALLVAGELDISLDTNDWFERNLLSISAERIRSISFQHGETESLSLQRANKDDPLTMDSIPEGREADTAAIGRLTSLLENIYVDDVKATDRVTFPDEKVVTTVNTFDGLLATITTAEVDGVNYISFIFSYDQSKPESANKETKEDSETNDVEKEVAELNKLVAGWVYEIPAYKSESFQKKIEDLLVTIESEETE